MAIPQITVKNGATSVVAPTGGSDLAFTPIVPGKMSNLSASLSTPMYLEIDSTIKPEGGESSYLFKLVWHKQRTNPDANDESDAKFSVHTVIKCELKDWSDAEIVNGVQMQIQALLAPGVLTRILRGDR